MTQQPADEEYESGHMTDILCPEDPLPSSPEVTLHILTPAPSNCFSRRSFQSDRSHPFHEQQDIHDERIYNAYIQEQFDWRRHLQEKYRVINYLSIQPQVTVEMRAKLIHWLIEVNRQFDYEMETFLLTVNFIDRFLAITPLALDCLQLLGVAALLVAAKKEEVFPPEISEMVRLCGGAYEARHIRQMEIVLLSKLRFHLCAPTASYFFEYYLSLNKIQTDIRFFREVADQLFQFSIANYELCQFVPSIMAAAAIFSTREQEDIERCAFQMSVILEAWRNSLLWSRSTALCEATVKAETAATARLLSARKHFATVLYQQMTATSLIPR